MYGAPIFSPLKSFMDFESGIEQWLRSPDRVMGFVFLSFTLIAPVQFKLLQKNSSKRWNELTF